MVPHLHKYKFDCKPSNGHSHKTFGYTDNMIGINIFHFHYFWGICSYTGHTHYYSGFTGLPVKTENGHIHKIEGILELNSLHEHPFSNYTFEEVGYISNGIFRKALI